MESLNATGISSGESEAIQEVIRQNEYLTDRVEAMNRHMTSLQTEILTLKKANEELTRKVVYFEGECQLGRHHQMPVQNNIKISLTPTQEEFLKKREESRVDIEVCLSKIGNEDLIKKISQELNSYNAAIKETFRQTNISREELVSIENELCKEEKEKKCVHCHKYFHPRLNADTSCTFHPGALKFYSCKSCGADPYHVCCGLCDNCSEGCQTSKHVSQLSS